MIAGLAIAHRAAIATRDVKHFDDANLDAVNPWQS
jgi:predicted nucleic acid-binding protein